jgi:GntR family carbon starvation induced transcriptional regulator
MTPPKTNHSATIRCDLRSEILGCSLRPGERLVISDLCDRFGVSLGAVREALSALVGEGLVVAHPKRGFHVVGMSLRELHELTEARVQVEAACLRLSVARGDLDWEARVTGALYKLNATPRKDPGHGHSMSEAWSQAHREFHEALVAACANNVLLGVRVQLYETTERYRRLSVPAESTDRDVAAEHCALAQAALARDSELVSVLIAVHLQKTAGILSMAVAPKLASGNVDQARA